MRGRSGSASLGSFQTPNGTPRRFLAIEKRASTGPANLRGQGSLRRNIPITNALAYVGQRGFDMDALLRSGFGDRIRISITLWLSHLHGQGQEALEHLDSNTLSWLERFREFVGEPDIAESLGVTMAKAMQGGFDDTLSNWVIKAPLPALVDWEYLAEDQLSAYPNHDGDAEAAVWIIQRFTQTYLSQWSDIALAHEYRYLQTGSAPGIDDDQLGLRVVSELLLLREMGQRTIAGHATSVRLDRVKSQAISRLCAGQQDEAAALFDAVRTLEPTNSEAHNNFAFCVLPDDPGLAIEALRRSESLETAPFPINRANQALTHLLLGDLESAQLCVDSAYAGKGHLPESALLWTNYEPLASSELKIDTVQPLSYVCELGLFIAGRRGVSEDEAAWAARILQIA